MFGSIYEYRLINTVFTKKQLENHNNRLLEQFSIQTKKWDTELNTEWTARNYMSAKMLLAATLMLNSVTFANKRNLKVVEPYLLYYALFSCCRGFILTLPNTDWKDGSMFELSHQKIINITVDGVARFNIPYSKTLRKTLIRAKDYRELFSYKMPTSGISSLPKEVSVSIEEIITLCTLLAELAQFQSECLERSLNKNCSSQEYGYSDSALEKVIWYTTEDYAFVDDDDAYRISRIIKKLGCPTNIQMTISAGMVDDFFGAWFEDNNNDSFNPDLNTELIFDFF